MNNRKIKLLSILLTSCIGGSMLAGSFHQNNLRAMDPRQEYDWQKKIIAQKYPTETQKRHQERYCTEQAALLLAKKDIEEQINKEVALLAEENSARVAEQIEEEYAEAEAQAAPGKELNVANGTEAVVTIADQNPGFFDQIKDVAQAHPHIIKGVAALAGAAVLYQAKDRILAFDKKYPYITRPATLVAAGIAGTCLYTGAPLLTCLTTSKPVMEFGIAAGKAIIYSPLILTHWVSSMSITVRLIMAGWGWITNTQAQEDKKPAIHNTVESKEATQQS